jgi:lysophospholipase L1-like esterase
MTRFKGFARITVAALTALVIATSVFAQARGKADFTTFVAIGDSYGAGYQSSSLNEHHQPFSWAAFIAKQAGLKICPVTAVATDTCFAIPLISYPGLGPEMILLPAGPVSGTGSGSPLMFGFGRSYNNLSVPGYTVAAALALTGSEANSGLGQVILRGRGNEVDQALSLSPTFVAVWLGGNDFLGAVSSGTTTSLTATDTFRAQYNALLDKLIAGAPNAGMVVGTLPQNFAAAPFTGALPPVVFDSNFQPVTVGGMNFPLLVDNGSGTGVPLPAGSIVLLSALPRIQQGYGIPAALKGFPPFNQLPHVGEPLSDAETITPTERAVFDSRIADYNSIIIQAGQAHNIPVADIKGLFDRFATGVQVGPFVLTNQYVRGGLFSLDGVHLTDIGYALFANEYIKAINSGYHTHIPLAGIAQFLQNNDPATQSALSLRISQEAAQQMIEIFNSASVTAPPRRRATH